MAIPIDAGVHKALAAGQPTAGWKDLLIRNDRGSPKGLLANCLVAFRPAPAWQGVFAFNDFSFATTVVGAPPWGGAVNCDWTDNHDRLATEWLQNSGIHVSVEVTAQAVQTAAIENRFHPVRDYLDALTWDGDPRVDSWLTTYLGVEGSNYSAAVGRRWLISAIA